MFDAAPGAARDVVAHPRLERLVYGVHQLDEAFSGLGLVFCESVDAVPHIALYPGRPQPASVDVCTQLIERSTFSTPCHDGFHLLKPNWDLLALSVFLAPPFTREPFENPDMRGSRWLAALLTSRLPGVIACLTIARVDRRATLFVNGRTSGAGVPPKT